MFYVMLLTSDGVTYSLGLQCSSYFCTTFWCNNYGRETQNYFITNTRFFHSHRSLPNGI